MSDDRDTAARAAGLRPELANRLVGATPMALLQDAHRLVKVVGRDPEAPPPASFGGGVHPHEPTPANMNDRIRAAALEARRNAGSFNL